VGIHDAIARLARAVASNDTSTARTQRAPQLTVHMGTIAAVDTGTNTAHFTFNDPTGTVSPVPGVRYLQAYTPDNPPQAGDIVWAHHYGTDLMIIGRHVVPTSTVIP